MKQFITMYAVFSVILLAFIFLFTIIQESNARSLNLFYEFADEAKTTNDLDRFVKYQSVAYEMIDEIETVEYTFHLYQVIALIDDEHQNQFSVFVIPKNDVDHAQVLADTSDQTGIILRDHATDNIIYSTNTDDDYIDYAVSYGITRIGFYYYAIVLDQDYEIDMVLKDYNNQNIVDQTISFTHVDFDETNLGTLSLGYTNDEIAVLLDLPSYTQPALLENIALFLVVDILVGAIIHFILKRKSI